MGARALSLLLTVLLIFYVIPATVYAEVGSAFSDEETAETATESTVTENNGANALDYTPVLYEVTDLREEGVKHFHLEDGSYMAAQYAYPVHYLDDSGEWQDIDNSLTESGGMLANSTARIKFAKKITGNSTLFTLHDGNTKLTMSLVGAQKGTVGEATNYADAESDTELQKMMNLEKLSSRVLYADILDGVDLEYIAQSLNVKENIIVKEKADAYSYTFELALNNLTATLADNGDVVITDSDGAAKYTIPAPVVYDAARVYAPASVSRYSLESSNGNGKYLLTVTTDTAWMNAAERVFPVTVDPTIAHGVSVGDSTITSASPDTVDKTSTTLTVSPTAKSYVPIMYSANDFYDYIISVKICLKNVSGTGSYVGAYATYGAAPDATWNQLHSEDSGISQYIDPEDYQYIDTVGEWYSWDVTRVVLEIIDEGAPGSIYMMIMQGENEIKFASSRSTSGAPTVITTYKNMVGLEDYWTTASQDIGYAGTGNVNLANGNLTLSVPTLSTKDGIMSSTVSLVYNSNAQVGCRNNTPFLPYGWGLNIYQTIRQVSYVDPITTQITTYYVYTDEDGTDHAFFATDQQDTYTDEDGLQLKLDTTNIDLIKITDLSKNIYTFARNGESTQWRLCQVTDISQNHLIITADNSYRPILVTLKPDTAVGIDYIRFLYNDSGKLSLILNSAAREAVAIRYDSNGYLTQLDFAFGASSITSENWIAWSEDSTADTDINIIGSASYTYEYNGISEVKDITSDYKIKYFFGGAGSRFYVWRATEYFGDTKGQTNDFSYSNSSAVRDTSVITYESDGSGKKYKYYYFDLEGRATMVRAQTENWVSFGEYSEDANIKNNLSSYVTSTIPSINLLANGMFKLNDLGTELEHWILVGNATFYQADNGEGDVKLAPSVNSTDSVSQNVFLKAGTYTVSMPITSMQVGELTARIKIESISGSGFSFTKDIPLSPTNQVTTDFSATFTVLNYVDKGDKLKVSVEATCGNTASGSVSHVSIGHMMLESGNGSSNVSRVDMGSLESNSMGTSATFVSSNEFWITESGDEPAIAVNSSNDHYIKITGSLTEERYVKQRVYEATDAVISKYGGLGTSNLLGKFLVSGDVRPGTNYQTDGAFAGIRVDVIYYQGPTTPDVTVSHKFYASHGKIFGYVDTEYEAAEGDTNIYKCVKAIDIYCEYSKQATESTAIFDDITFTGCGDGFTADYYYYQDSGLLAYEDYGFNDVVFYEYNDNKNISRIANNDGELTDYYYFETGNINLVNYTVNYSFTYGNSGTYPFFNNDSPPDELIVKTPEHKTEYTYDAYGLLTKVETYDVEYAADGVTVQRSTNAKSITTNYTYDTTSGSKTFGKLIAEDNGVDRGYYYSYDTSNGRLLSVINRYEATAVYYEYDAKGNLVHIRPAVYDEENLNLEVDIIRVAYCYNAKNFLSEIETPSTVYQFEYDEFGNQTVVKIDATNEEDNIILASYEYYESNRFIHKIVYGNGLTVEYVYNSLDYISEIWYTYSDGTRELAYSYEYTKYGQLSEYVDHRKKVATAYTYDNIRRLTGIVEYSTDDMAQDFKARVIYGTNYEISLLFYYVDYLMVSDNETTRDYSEIWYSYNYNTDGSMESEFLHADGGLRGTIKYQYDEYDRLSSVNMSEYFNSGTFTNNVAYEYRTYTDTTGNTYTDSAVSKYTSTVGTTTTTFNYTYDNAGRITKITNSDGDEIRYYYDDYGQLIREENDVIGTVYAYTYDDAGNVKTYTFTSSSGYSSTTEYKYQNTVWGDLLTARGDNAITYDEIGNPLTYNNGYNYTFVWEGRNLISATVRNKTYTMTYNDEGLRTSKTVNGVTTYYYYDGDLLVSETTGDVVVVYHYDAVGSPIGFQYRDGSYSRDDWDVFWYQKNLQGDIIAIYDNTGKREMTYNYTAWGHMVTNNCLDIDFDNPFTYRGYYYDHDLHLYYLNSRYYDSTNCRFINADSALYHKMLGYNMFAYCNNDPVNYADYSGESATAILGWWCSTVGTVAVAEPTYIGEIVLVAGVVVIGAIELGLWLGEEIIETIDNSKKSIPETLPDINGNTKNETDLEKKVYKAKSGYNPNPYARPGEKKQNRENRNKSRESENWKPRNNKRDGKPAKPKSHSPSKKGHRKYFDVNKPTKIF